MAFRIGDHVAAGTIENTVKGRVTGTLKIAGLDGVVTLDLQGNAHPDMAGCILQFANPHATPIDPADTESFRRGQVGHAGDISASQKRKVPKGYPNLADDFSFAPSDFVLSNILYLEWFDHYNGAVVIEGVGYQWQIDLPRWRLDASEVELQAGQSADARNLFMNLAMEQDEDDEEEDLWDGEDEDDWGDEEVEEETEIDPEADDEYSWEARLKKSDQRTDALMALLDTAESDQEREEILRKALESGIDADAADPFGSSTKYSPWDEPDLGGERFRDIDHETMNLAIEVRDLTGSLLFTDLKDTVAANADLLPFAVKTRVAAEEIIKAEGTPFDGPDDMPMVQPGFLIARFKREIARAETLAVKLSGDESVGRNSRCLEVVREIRDRLVVLCGNLRKLR